MVALSGTVLVIIYQACAAAHDIFFPLEVTLALFKQITYVFLDNAFPHHVPGILCHNILWISGLKPFLI